MDQVAEGTYFFMHIMKTAGTSFAQHLDDNFSADEIYPHPSTKGPRHIEQYWKVAEVRGLTAEQRQGIRVYAGHFPFMVAGIIDADVTLTILREPVERTISALHHLERHFPQHRGKALEEIYDDPWHHPTWLRNYQAKLFALTADDDVHGHIHVLDVDEARYATAVTALESVSLFGLTERFDEFTDEVNRRYGWTFRDNHRRQVGPWTPDVSPYLRNRIESDNQADIAFYQHARNLYRARVRSARML